MSDRESIVSQRARKLKELYFLFTNPLQSLDTFVTGDASFTAGEFFRDNDVSKGKPVLIMALPRVNDEESLKKEMANAIQTELYKLGSNELKRPSDNTTSRKAKAHKSSIIDYPSRLMPLDTKQKRKISAVTSLKSQIEVLEEETNKYLNKDINELDILSLPEHYPTDVHTVSSLAELYYLTQTLPLIKLLPGSHKTLMTENFELALLEGKIGVLYSRIEELKRQKKWSLRQPMRYYDPFLYSKRNKKAKSYHWDTLLQEGKWMAADFKEATKFKKACCVSMAQGVQDYWAYGKVMCIKRKRIYHIGEERPEELIEKIEEVKLENTEVDAQLMIEADSGAPSDVVMMGETDTLLGEEIPQEGEETSLIKDEVEVTPMEIEPASVVDATKEPSEESVEAEVNSDTEEPLDPEPMTPEEDSIDISLLLQRPNPEDEIVPPTLPQYTAEDLEKAGILTKDNNPFKTHVTLKDLKKLDQSIVLNLPKFTAFDDDALSLMLHPPLKPGETSIVAVSRMLYPFEQDDSWYKIVLKDSAQTPLVTPVVDGPPEFQKGLFGVQSHRRFNYLKPPKPPLIKNIEYRSPTIWLPQDDKYLIHFVAEYCFNWDLIAENLNSSASTLKRYESNIERRTPWQCFERYIQLNEKFQFSDMKGINAYLAQQWLEHAHKAQLTTKRRISPLGVGNESIQRGHRRLRWASMFDAIRKTMRKREASQAETSRKKTTDYTSLLSSTSANNTASSFAGNAALNGVLRPGDGIPTPSELSKLKFDRDKTIQEAYLNQQATRSRMMAAVSQLKSSLGASPTLRGDSNVAPNQRRISQPSGPGSRSSDAASTSALQRPVAATLASQPTSQLLGGIKRPTTPNGTPYTVEQIQQLLQIQKQRRMMQQQNQASKGVSPGTTSTLTALQNSAARKVTGAPSSSSSMSGYSTTSSVPGSSASLAQAMGKRASTPTKGRLQFAPAQVSAIINSIQQKNPNLTKEQVTKLAASYLANLQQQQQARLQQSSVNAPTRTQASSSSVQQNLGTARQAQLQRQRLAAGKEMDPQTLSKMQYEERKKLMMGQPSSPFLSAASSPTFTPSPNLSKSQLSPLNSAPPGNESE